MILFLQRQMAAPDAMNMLEAEEKRSQEQKKR